MKRKMPKLMLSAVSYEPLCSEEIGDVNGPPRTKKKGILCASSKKRMYALMILSGVALLWVFIYYKLLNHRFELPEPLRELRKMFGDGEVKKRRGREDETENVVVTTLADTACLPQFSEERKSEYIHIAIVACGKLADEALVNMKAATLVSNANLFFHIFTDEKHIKRKTFDKELQSWPAMTQHWLMFTVYPIYYPVNQDHTQWLELFKLCASQRLFLASILVHIDSVIYVDTDVLFLRPPEDLWEYFNNFNNTQIAGMVRECEPSTSNCWYNKQLSHPYVQPYGVNSGVMLMNLTRMRNLKWENELISIYNDYNSKIAYGDQDILNIYFHRHMKSLFFLSCDWNYRPLHCIHGNLCSKAKRNGVSLMHGNHGVFRDKKVLPEFFAVYDAYSDYEFFHDVFQKDVVKNAYEKLSKLAKKKDASKCARMKNAMLKHIRCKKTDSAH